MPPAPQQDSLLPTPLKILIALGVVLAVVAGFLLISGSGGDGGGDSTKIASTDTTATTEPDTTDKTTATTESTSTEETTVEPTTTVAPPRTVEDLYTTPNFAFALTVMKSKLGSDADLVRLQLNGYFLDAQVRKGTKIKGVRFDAMNIAFSDNPVLVPPFKPAKEVDFPIKVVDPSAVNRILAGVKQITHSTQASFIGLDLRRDPVDNSLRWEITAQTPNEIGIILYTDPDGRHIRTLDQQSAITSP